MADLDTMRSALESIASFARQCMQDGGSFLPCFIAHHGTQQTMMVAPDLGDPKAKYAILAQIRAHMREINADFYVCAHDAWIVSRRDADSMPEGSLEHCSDRKECISVFAADTERCIHRSYIYNRSDTGKVIFVSENAPEFSNDDPRPVRMSGSFAQLLVAED